MKITFSVVCLLAVSSAYSQTKTSDTLKQNDITEVVLLGKKPTVENKVDRTVFNVANSSILAGNTTWDVLRMAPLVSIDNNDVIKAEGESVTVYINDRKSIFTGKDLKEYLLTIPAENLMKIEVITSPSARYDGAGEVINIVLKKLDNEGFKGSATFNNSQNKKNSQYSNLNINYHKKNFTQSISGSYGDNTSLNLSDEDNFRYDIKERRQIATEAEQRTIYKSISSSSEYELNDKNNIGLVVEFSQNDRNNFSNSLGNISLDGVFQNSFTLDQNADGYNRNLGTNLFYKYYDKEKNKILDLNAGFNYDSREDQTDNIRDIDLGTLASGSRILGDNENRNYFLKADYSQSLGKSGSQIEFGGKMDFKNNVVPYDYLNFENNFFVLDNSRSNNFHYSENLNSVYGNFSKTFFSKLETRVGLRYEYINYKIRQDVGRVERKDDYGTLLPNLLLKYSFTDNYNLSLTYSHNIYRPYYSEFNPFELPQGNGNFSRGNLNLEPNPSDRIGLKLGFFKKYFLSANYSFTNQDFWDSFIVEGNKTISLPVNFVGKSARYSLNFNTNQSFFSGKMNVNMSFGGEYLDNSDFNRRNNLGAEDYISNFNGNTNISYTNLFNKNININAYASVFTQNSGNSIGNKPSVFHNISATKIFKNLQLEATLRLVNPFSKLKFDTTTYSQIGTFRNRSEIDYHGFSFSLVKRFGNQKVKENSKTDVEKDGGGK